MAGPEKDANEARQGVTGTGTRYVLAISLAAAFILLVACAWFFFGPPVIDVETGRTAGDSNPPYTSQESPDDWRDNPPPEATDNR